jgi:hypothetical protein
MNGPANALYVTAHDGYTYFRIGTLRVLLYRDGDIWTSRCNEITNDGNNRSLWESDPEYMRPAAAAAPVEPAPAGI